MAIGETLATRVRMRAGSRCEYCRLPESCSSIPFEIDHIVALKHGGQTVEGNLALACFYCNSGKGPNIAGRDPRTRRLAALFNPRKQRWADHFVWEGATLVGRTAVGCTTVFVLAINHPGLVALREFGRECP